MSLWNADTIKDVSESVGIANISDEVAKDLAMDVEYRMHQVLQEALKFMRHSKRTTLGTQDIAHALRVLDVEPLYGYESTRPLRFGEASLGQAQPIFYVEDDEVDFEKLINAPLPKVPREVAFTAHWLAIEGVQPAIPQNPTQAEAARLSESTPKGASTSNSLAASAGGGENVAVKPLVKHILSKELQLYFERVCTAVTDEQNETLRSAALSSLRNDPGLHQLVPYFVQFISEKVTHSLKQMFILTQMMHLAYALLENANLFIEPYVPSLIPPILTCLIGKHLGDPTNNPLSHYPLRDFSASLIKLICNRFGDSTHTLKPRLTRTCLKHFLDPAKPFGTHYGSITGLSAIGGRECVRVLILPNVKLFEKVIRQEVEDDSPKRKEAEMCVTAIVNALKHLEEIAEVDVVNGQTNGNGLNESLKTRLVDRVGEIVGEEVWKLGKERLVRVIVDPPAESA
ncbi:histone H4-like TAF Taf6, SAGA complex subunit [Rhizina undulata]